MSAESVDTPESVEIFIKRWETAEASERSNYGMFITELCDLLELPHPDPSSKITTSKSLNVCEPMGSRHFSRKASPFYIGIPIETKGWEAFMAPWLVGVCMDYFKKPQRSEY